MSSMKHDVERQRIIDHERAMAGDAREQVAMERDVLRKEREELLEALKALLPYVERYDDAGPQGKGWQSKELEAEISKAQALLARIEGKSIEAPTPSSR